jgi:hypothetical protein
MLWTIIAILVILWLFGTLSAFTIGGLIHVLLVVAVILVIFKLIDSSRSRSL